MELYRSGHNGAHSKCVSPPGHAGSNPAVSAVTKPGRITGRWFYRVFLCHSFSKTTPFFRKKYLFFGKVFHEVFHEIHLQHFTNYYQSMDIWITCIPAWISYGQSIDKSWKSQNTFPTIYQPLFPQASPHFHIKQVPHIPTLSTTFTDPLFFPIKKDLPTRKVFSFLLLCSHDPPVITLFQRQRIFRYFRHFRNLV